MRKKSHISVAKFLIDNMNVNSLHNHKLSFLLGSILPDCMPSFLTRKHTIEETFYILKKEIRNLTEEYDAEKGEGVYFCRHLGIITHYVADYFTFPHNKNYTGSLKDHCQYEKILKHKLREYVKAMESRRERMKETRFETLEELFVFIHEVHEKYLKRLSEVKKDIQYIVDVCFEVVDAILRFIEIQLSENRMIPQTI